MQTGQQVNGLRCLRLGWFGAAALVMLGAVPVGHELSLSGSAHPDAPGGLSSGAHHALSQRSQATRRQGRGSAHHDLVAYHRRARKPIQTLHLGSHGKAVLSLQRQLNALGYWTGAADGNFGDGTEQAVYALQKIAGIPPDGVVGGKTLQALAKQVRPIPRSTTGRVIEINLRDDVIMFVDHGRLQFTINTSTGGGYSYTEKGVTDVAVTPTGRFHIYRVVDGTVTDPLGQLWRPRFFYSGFAIHGDGYVPPEPVSHGCARVSNEAIDWIWAKNLAPLGTPVWVYSKAPKASSSTRPVRLPAQSRA